MENLQGKYSEDPVTYRSMKRMNESIDRLRNHTKTNPLTSRWPGDFEYKASGKELAQEYVPGDGSVHRIIRDNIAKKVIGDVLIHKDAWQEIFKKIFALRDVYPVFPESAPDKLRKIYRGILTPEEKFERTVSFILKQDVDFPNNAFRAMYQHSVSDEGFYRAIDGVVEITYQATSCLEEIGGSIPNKEQHLRKLFDSAIDKTFPKLHPALKFLNAIDLDRIILVPGGGQNSSERESERESLKDLYQDLAAKLTKQREHTLITYKHAIDKSSYLHNQS